MHISDNSKSFDYSYLISVGGVGILLSCAVLMFGIGFGNINIGYLGGAFVLLSTAIFLLLVLVKASAALSAQAVEISLVKNDKAGVAMLMTSMSGELVYANKPAKALFEKYEFGKPKSPLKIDISDKNVIQETIETISTGEVKSVIAQVRDSEIFLQFEVEKFYKNGDFYSWRIFENVEKGNPINFDEMRPDYFHNIGSFFEKTDIGFFTVNENNSVTYINDYLIDLIFNGGKKPDIPFNLSLVSQHSRSNLINKVQFISSKNGDFNAVVKEWPNTSVEGVNCYLVMADEKNGTKTDKGIPENKSRDDFFSSSPIGIAVIDKKGEILDKNIVFSNFISELDIEQHENLSDILVEENAGDVFKEIKTTLKSGKPSQIIELDFKGLSDKQGQFYITGADGGKSGANEVVAYLTDITKQKSLELQFTQSQKMQAVGQLAGGVAHDFNNLLTAITGFCDLLLVKHGPGDQSFSDIIQIKQNANRAANLVRQLLAFSRQQTLRPKVLVMTDVVAELSNLLRRLIGSNIELEINHGRDIEPVKVDQGQLEQVIINLCVNSRDAMPDGGKLEIITCNISEEDSVKIHRKYPIVPTGEYVSLEVSDNGTGIAKEHLEKVFEPFFSTKDVGKGTGLGLSTVYGIIKQTDGFVFPESEVGVGTSFKIYLPKHDQVDDEEVEVEDDTIKPEESARDLTGSSTILLVEDEDAVRMFASRALKNKGYTVYEADCGISALKVLEETEAKIDLLISDVMMPQMDGPSLVKKIRETDKTLKVIFISGYAEDALDDNITDKDFNFLSKPFSLKQLAEEVKEVLDK